MKRIKSLSTLLVLIVTLGFISCDTEPVDPVFLDYEPEETITGGTFTVDIDGETFTATSTLAAIESGSIVIQGLRGTNGESVSILIPNANVGTYDDALMDYKPSDESDFGYLNVDPDFNVTGSVTISSIDTANNTISGSFQFTGYWSNDDGTNLVPVVLTSGVFTNIPYTGINPSNNEYFRAQVGGVEKEYSLNVAAVANTTINLIGKNIDPASEITLLMNVNITPGTYTIDGGSIIDGNISASYSEDPDTYETLTGGELTIISYSEGWIKGEFTFSVVDADDNVIEITNGEFNLELP